MKGWAITLAFKGRVPLFGWEHGIGMTGRHLLLGQQSRVHTGQETCLVTQTGKGNRHGRHLLSVDHAAYTDLVILDPAHHDVVNRHVYALLYRIDMLLGHFG